MGVVQAPGQPDRNKGCSIKLIASEIGFGPSYLLLNMKFDILLAPLQMEEIHYFYLLLNVIIYGSMHYFIRY